MAKATPVESDPAIRLWAQLAIIEQCSLAIVHRSFPLPEPERSRTLTALRGANLMFCNPAAGSAA